MATLLEFFGLQRVGWFPVILLVCFVFLAAVGIVSWKYEIPRKMRESGLSWIAFIPLIGRRFRRQAAEWQSMKAKKGIIYAPENISIEERRNRFREFSMDLPVYCINDDFFSSICRNLLSKGGANFQQVVLHDTSSIEDTYVWVRKEGNYFTHDKGIYLFPWDMQKSILHWDIQDARPMEDKSPQAQWQSPKMNARYWWGVVNSVAMNKETGQADTKTMLMLGAVVLTLLVSVYIAYSTGKADDQQTKILLQIANNTMRGD